MINVIVIGGGAAGMFAAIHAARLGHQVTLLEKNEKLGKKIFITGKGRCNLTNAGDMEELFASVISNSKFLYSSFYGFDNFRTIEFFESLGLKTKIERGNRVFPESDHSSDVIRVLSRELDRQGVDVRLNTNVKRININEGAFESVTLSNGNELKADKCIVCTGGLSYTSTGSTGDGLRFAEETGHKVTATRPSLVPFEIEEAWVSQLQGLALKNVNVTIYDGKKKIYDDFGEMLFTHFGVSGPLILTASCYAGKKLEKKPLSLKLDLKPALSPEQLDHRVLRDFEENQNKAFKNAISKLFPSKLIPVMIELSGIDPEKKVHSISKEERSSFVNLIKNVPMTVTALRKYNEAIITQGGVSVKQINPSTMESKLVSGLFFAGEVLDLDAVTGGFNLQIAWSTAYTAATNLE
ncbi:MAG: NAD(P)/FAD-dependent oxidoreductase [Dorea sp.]|nr:NAD(P)/FAD-dependent oxidoreductase [Dorea sp.]